MTREECSRIVEDHLRNLAEKGNQQTVIIAFFWLFFYMGAEAMSVSKGSEKK
jgi:hypothetical protein